MNTLKDVGIAILIILAGCGAIAWHLVEKKDGSGRTIIWVAEIIPIPLLLVGIGCVLSGAVIIVNLFM